MFSASGLWAWTFKISIHMLNSSFDHSHAVPGLYALVPCWSTRKRHPTKISTLNQVWWHLSWSSTISISLIIKYSFTISSYLLFVIDSQTHRIIGLFLQMWSSLFHHLTPTPSTPSTCWTTRRSPTKLAPGIGIVAIVVRKYHTKNTPMIRRDLQLFPSNSDFL